MSSLMMRRQERQERLERLENKFYNLNARLQVAEQYSQSVRVWYILLPRPDCYPLQCYYLVGINKLQLSLPSPPQLVKHVSQGLLSLVTRVTCHVSRDVSLNYIVIERLLLFPLHPTVYMKY